MERPSLLDGNVSLQLWWPHAVLSLSFSLHTESPSLCEELAPNNLRHDRRLLWAEAERLNRFAVAVAASAVLLCCVMHRLKEEVN